VSDNLSDAGNQQETLVITRGSSETIRRAPFSRREIVAYLQGALHDATFSSNSRFRFSQKGREWLEVLQGMFTSLGHRSWIYREGKTRDVYVLETLADFLDFKFDPLNLKTKKQQCAYIQGFFDAEGGIPHSVKDKFYIQLVQNDQEKLSKIKQLLESMGISVGIIHNPSRKLHPEYWRMFILLSGHKKFVKIVGTQHPRKINFLRERMMI
jgi:intein-encoded DNA endonuclease-like protein